MKKVISFICSSLFFVIGFAFAFSINVSACAALTFQKSTLCL